MIPVVIDTDTLSFFFKKHPKVIQKVQAYGQVYNRLNISIITYYEILNGLLYRDAKRQLIGFKHFIQANTLLPLTQDATQIAAEIYAELRRTGQPIGHTDVLIAGIAIANNMPLVTNNTKHFARIPHLTLINWVN